MKILGKTTVQTDVTSVGTSYDVTKLHTHVLTDISALASGWGGNRMLILETVHVWVKSISSATTLTICVAMDPAGDQAIVPSTTATITTGLTTSTKGAVAVQVQTPIFTFGTGSSLYLFAKTDAGTVTIDASAITYSYI